LAAPEATIKGGDARVTLRNPVNSAIFDLITLGIYGLYWYYQVNREMADLGRARGTTELGENPTNSLLALIPGGFVIVPAVISMWNACKRVMAAQRLAGQAQPQLNNVAAFALLLLVAPVGIWYIQSELNKVWASETAPAELPGAPQAQPPGAPAEQQPSPTGEQAPPPGQQAPPPGAPQG
jgi:hypothetical protein